MRELKTAEFDTVVEAEELAVIDFWADWCGPCKMLAPAVAHLAEKYEGRALVAKVNVDQEPELAQRFGVMSIPTLVFLKKGREFERKVGVMPPEIFEQIIQANL